MDNFKKYLQENASYNISLSEPNNMVWQKINASLEPQKSQASVIPFIKYAVAATIFGIAVVTMFHFMGNKQISKPMVDTINNKCHPQNFMTKDTPFKKSNSDTQTIGFEKEELQNFGLCALLKNDDTAFSSSEINVKKSVSTSPNFQFNTIEKQRNATDATQFLLKNRQDVTNPIKNRFNTNNSDVELQEQKYLA